jgi:hypothetical protein
MGRDATPDVAELRRLAGRVAADMDRRDVLDLEARIAQLERQVDGLIDALRCREVIGQAEGVLMSHYAIDPDAAFERLRELARAANVEIVELASAFVGQVRTRGPVCAGDHRTINEILEQLTETGPTRRTAGTEAN